MDAQRLKFIVSIAASVISAATGTHLFPSVMLAQAAMESANGTSLLSKKYHNYFGIKQNGWKGEVAILSTHEYIKGVKTKVNAAFRAYGSLVEGFADRIAFLQKNPRYTKAGVFKAANPQEQAKALQAAGYATDPLYAKGIIDMIRIYGLEKYDQKA